MNPSVNLLPPELAVQRRARRQARLTGALVLVWVAALGGLYALKVSDVANAERARDDAQLQVAQLEQELESLDEYRVLSARIDARSALLTSAMADELSWARILNDLSLVFPADASMLTLGAAMEPEEEIPTGGEIDQGAPVASVVFSGYSVDRLSPGVEQVLTDFDESSGFDNSFLQTAGEGERGETDVLTFNGSFDLNDEALTHRYDDGLPKEMTP